MLVYIRGEVINRFFAGQNKIDTFEFIMDEAWCMLTL